MIFPFSTDAPLYHLPYATVGLIVANVGAFFISSDFGFAMTTESPGADWILEFDRIHPLQWVTNCFLHADILHLLGNMFFLWVFGLIVEGKIGWWRFLLLYLGMCCLDGAMIQIPMFLLTSGEGGALGASGVIFALLAIAMIWAPQNEVRCFLFAGFFSRVFEIAVWSLGFFYFALQVIGVALTGFEMSSAVLHLAGLAIGFPVGIVAVKKDWVDCEGYDLFSQWWDPPEKEKTTAEAATAMFDPTSAPMKKEVDHVKESIHTALEEGHPVSGLAMYKKFIDKLDYGRRLDPRDLLQIVNLLLKQQNYDDAIQPMVALLAICPSDQAIPIRLKLAQILILREERPQQGLKVLDKLPLSLSPQQDELRNKLKARARQQLSQGVVELDVNDW